MSLSQIGVELRHQSKIFLESCLVLALPKRNSLSKYTSTCDFFPLKYGHFLIVLPKEILCTIHTGFYLFLIFWSQCQNNIYPKEKHSWEDTEQKWSSHLWKDLAKCGYKPGNTTDIALIILLYFWLFTETKYKKPGLLEICFLDF
jgi:hypothetical protein